MKETPKTQQQVSLVKKKQKRSFKRKNAKSLESFFFRSKFLFREKHTTEEENFVVREISLQTHKPHKRGQTTERREQNRKSWPPLSPPLRFWCVPFRRRQSRLVEEGGGGAKEAPIIIR